MLDAMHTRMKAIGVRPCLVFAAVAFAACTDPEVSPASAAPNAASDASTAALADVALDQAIADESAQSAADADAVDDLAAGDTAVDVTPDAADIATPDVASPDAGPGVIPLCVTGIPTDPSALCAGIDCDDGDPCSLDLCVAGSCMHAAVGAQVAAIPGAAAGEHLGAHVAIANSTLVVAGDNSATAQIFLRKYDAWLPAVVLSLPDAVTGTVVLSVAATDIAEPAYMSAAIGSSAGSVAYFETEPAGWALREVIPAPNGATGGQFGAAVAIGGWGDLIVVGAPGGAGHVYAYHYAPTNNSPVEWVLQAEVTPANPLPNDHFGTALAFSGDTLVIGAPGDVTSSSGRAYVFIRIGPTWSEQAKLQASNGDFGDRFGEAVAIYGDTIVIGARGEASGSNSNPADNSAPGRGAAYVFTRTGGVWSQQAYLKPPGSGGVGFGTSVGMHGDTLVVGAPQDGSGAVGLNAAVTSAVATDSGAAYVFTRSDDVWTQTVSVKSATSTSSGHFGASVSASSDSFAVGAPGGSGTANVFRLQPGCDDYDPCTADACVPLSGCSHSAIPGCLATCGNGICDGDETVPNCPADCSFLTNRYGGPCATPGSWNGCEPGFICVARSAAGGGNICVADFETWPPIADHHPACDFTEYPEFDVDNKTGLMWAKQQLSDVTWDVALTACTTETYGGYQDWRIPTEAELQSLVDASAAIRDCSAPNLQWLNPDLMSGVPRLDLNSANPNIPNGQTWGTLFTFTAPIGNIILLGQPRAVRCVRSSLAGGTGSGGRFALTDNGTTVRDRRTGLHWQQGLAKAALDWNECVAWCASTHTGLPGNGWHLPTVGALRQLVGRQTSPALDKVFTVDGSLDGSSISWTSTSGVDWKDPSSGYIWQYSGDADYVDNGMAWIGLGYKKVAIGIGQARCVR